jgi:superoxide reductase
VVFFLADGAKFPVQIARAEFNAHGESPDGPNMSTIYSNPEVSSSFRTDKSGTILASSYCNIHGLWQGAKKIEVK